MTCVQGRSGNYCGMELRYDKNNYGFCIQVKNPVSLTPEGFYLVAETGFEPVTFGL